MVNRICIFSTHLKPSSFKAMQLLIDSFIMRLIEKTSPFHLYFISTTRENSLQWGFSTCLLLKFRMAYDWCLLIIFYFSFCTLILLIKRKVDLNCFPLPLLSPTSESSIKFLLTGKSKIRLQPTSIETQNNLNEYS